MFCSATVLATSAAARPDDAFAVISIALDPSPDRALAFESAARAAAVPPSCGANAVITRALTGSDSTSASRSGAVFGVGVPKTALVALPAGSRSRRFVDASYTRGWPREYAYAAPAAANTHSKTIHPRRRSTPITVEMSFDSVG